MTIVAHTNASYNLDDPGTDTFKDAQNDAISRTGYDITPFQSFMTLNTALNELTFNDPLNADVGNYTFSIFCDDNYVSLTNSNCLYRLILLLYHKVSISKLFKT